MLIKVYAPAYCNHDVINEKGFVEMPDDCTLMQLLNKIKMPLIYRKLPIVFVNYERVKKTTKLKDKDIVSIMGFVSSG